MPQQHALLAHLDQFQLGGFNQRRQQLLANQLGPYLTLRGGFIDLQHFPAAHVQSGLGFAQGHLQLGQFLGYFFRFKAFCGQGRPGHHQLLAKLIGFQLKAGFARFRSGVTQL